jgi:hypothetical protein
MILYEDNYYLLYVKDWDNSGVIYMGIREGRRSGEYDHLLLIRVSSIPEHIKQLSTLNQMANGKAIQRGNLTSDLLTRMDNARQIFANIDMAMKPEPDNIRFVRRHTPKTLDDYEPGDLPF